MPSHHPSALGLAALMALGCGSSAPNSPNAASTAAAPPAASAQMSSQAPAEAPPSPASAPSPQTADAVAGSSGARATLRRLTQGPASGQIARCTREVGYEGEVDECRLALLGNGAALRLSLISNCAEMCDVDVWILRPGGRSPWRVPSDLTGGNIEADPTGSFLLLDGYAAGATEGSRELGSVRIDLDGGQRSFLPCFSATLSPRGRYFVCRNRVADVLRVPVGGGALEPIAVSGLSAEQVEWADWDYVYPEQVDFPTPTTLHFEVARSDADEPAERTLAWAE